MEIKNLKKAAKRILKAIEKKEKIILYGDADLDGAASVIILKESVKSLGGNICAIYFPDREIEGHGITKMGLEFLKKEAPALLIAVDCGIGNLKETAMAKKMGFSVLIVDHHEVLDKMPKADIIVDPKQKGDKYYFKGLAAAGVVFKLAEALFEEKMAKRTASSSSTTRAKTKGGEERKFFDSSCKQDSMTENLRKNFLELVALATLADMMPQEADNKVFISEGLQSLENSWRPGIKAFFETEFLEEFSGISQKVAKIISVLNVRDVESRFPASFRLLTVVSLSEAGRIIEELFERSKIRKEVINGTVDEIEKIIAEKDESIVFEGDSSFDLALLSAAASIICQKFQKPVFLYKKMAKESQGTVRVPSGVDSIALMKKCSKYPLAFGGHPKASGFRIKNDNLEKFKTCLIENYR